MKLQFVKMFLVLGLLIGLGNITARAQALLEGSIEADVPHAFIVKDTTLPAGRYTVQRVEETEPQVLEIRSANGRIAVIFEAQTAQINEVPRNPELVFDKIGDQYFLSQIWAADTNIGYQLPKTKAEKRLEGSGMPTEHHSIYAKLSTRIRKAK